MHMFLAPEQTANLFPTVTLVHALRTVVFYGDFKREVKAKPAGKTAVTDFIINGIEQPHAKRTNERGKKQYPETTIRIEKLDI